jgi:pimeloyl-ACP methyl ester carboxylesterase
MGFRLLAFERRGYGQSPALDGEDFLRDADDICDLMSSGAHLVGHSYGGLGALHAAARSGRRGRPVIVSRDHQGQAKRRKSVASTLRVRRSALQPHSYCTTTATVRTFRNAPVAALRAYTESV